MKESQGVEQLSEHRTVRWENLPDLPLYMDQVVTYLERQLELFQSVQSEKLVTASMVNNYVKSKLIPRPEKKKYTREHLARLLMVCTLKQVLPIQQVDLLVKHCAKDGEEHMLSEFGELQDHALAKAAEQYRQIAQSGQDLQHTALQLVLEINAQRLVAQMLLAQIAAEPEISTGAPKEG